MPLSASAKALANGWYNNVMKEPRKIGKKVTEKGFVTGFAKAVSKVPKALYNRATGNY